MLNNADHPDSGIFYFNDHNPTTLHQFTLLNVGSKPCPVEACNRVFD